MRALDTNREPNSSELTKESVLSLVEEAVKTQNPDSLSQLRSTLDRLYPEHERTSDSYIRGRRSIARIREEKSLSGRKLLSHGIGNALLEKLSQSLVSPAPTEQATTALPKTPDVKPTTKTTTFNYSPGKLSTLKETTRLIGTLVNQTGGVDYIHQLKSNLQRLDIDTKPIANHISGLCQSNSKATRIYHARIINNYLPDIPGYKAQSFSYSPKQKAKRPRATETKSLPTKKPTPISIQPAAEVISEVTPLDKARNNMLTNWNIDFAKALVGTPYGVHQTKGQLDCVTILHKYLREHGISFKAAKYNDQTLASGLEALGALNYNQASKSLTPTRISPMWGNSPHQVRTGIPFGIGPNYIWSPGKNGQSHWHSGIVTNIKRNSQGNVVDFSFIHASSSGSVKEESSFCEYASKRSKNYKNAYFYDL